MGTKLIKASSGGASALNDLSDVTYSSGDLTISSLDTIISGSILHNSSGNITLDADDMALGEGIRFDDDGSTVAQFSVHHSGSHFYLYENGGASADDFLQIKCEASGVSTISTTDAAGEDAKLILKPDGDIELDPGTGTIMAKNAGSDVGKLSPFQMLMWGGAMARNTGSAGEHRMIPTIFDGTNLINGTGTDPATSYTLTSTADHLNNRIVVFPDDITVVECKWSIGEGGATNTSHTFHLMRYDIDADGDLSSGVVVASGVNIASDDYTQLRILSTSLSGTASELNVAGDASQVLIAFVESQTATNTYDSCKVYLKYKWA